MCSGFEILGKRMMDMNVVQRDLQQVIKLIEEMKGPIVKQDKWRLGFHLMPPIGWLNDPNGLCFFNGMYHVFFQYSPFDATGGMKVWGHYTSSDFVHWEYRGTPMVTDQAEDSHGVYSGSSLIDGNKAYLYYTGNVKRLGNYDYIYSGREANTILVETEDMIHFKEKVCIMTNEDYGNNMSCHVRDPKVWKEADMYYMVQGARSKEGKGLVLVFASDDRYKWQLINQITTKQPFGYMWECPDLFELDGKRVLNISPQGIKANELDYWNIYQSGYYLLEGDFKGEYALGDFRELDRGFDFYAPQTFEDKQGRRILIGWMGLPDCEEEYHNPTVAKGWQHCLTLPRQLHIKENKVYQIPIEELETLRKDKRVYAIEEKALLDGFALEEIVLTDINDSKNFEMILENNITLTYTKADQVFCLQFLNESGAGRDKRMVNLNELQSLRIYRDHSALEVFINEGEEVFSTRYYPQEEVYTINIQCKAADITVWKLGEMSYGKK